jgi:sorting nexin-1/2
MDPDPWADAAPSQGASSQPEDASVTSPTKSTAPAAGSSGARPSRLTPRRLVAQPTRLQVVEDDPLGPLGGGGGAAAPGAASDDLPLRESPPAPPQKEQLPIRTTMPQPAAARRVGGPADPHRIDDDEADYAGSSGPRQPPPVQAALPSPVRSNMQPSMSVEQAAKPSFHISVGDPHKVGDLTSSHTVYSVRTKVGGYNALGY